MFTLLNIAQPESLQDAYKIVTAKKSNAILGGCTYLRMGSQTIHTGVDLAKLGLHYIKEHDTFIELGAMATLRDIETNAALNKYFNGLLPKAVRSIIGIQFRNSATVGASVFSRYGFSDFITALLALDTEVELYKGGRMALAEFLDTPRSKDILTKVIIHKTNRTASYQALRNSASDYPILTVAVSHNAGDWNIAVGARPTRAKLAVQAAALLAGAGADVTPAILEQAAQMAAAELPFGANMRASAEYRCAMCKTLVKRAIAEVAACK
ncbi:FAD binding domain-containing protein [Sporomusa malonica]|uniref:CO or xanthine dehydrogenase, FAD-binding subunit n=1 Tax=Sporomusa malonica TaxID=112901 RepID=A0A1W1YH57_9FIRM|nr:FAD binding domain-containing protein [Sporomusa malonica]SMC35489.1 CO or xanthine dehydrogenase, FAD-binding subunit [Sporomusa malonica]